MEFLIGLSIGVAIAIMFWIPVLNNKEKIFRFIDKLTTKEYEGNKGKVRKL